MSTAINSKYESRHLLSSDSENEKSIAQKASRISKVTKAVTENVDISAQDPTRKKTQIGSFVFSDSSSDESFVEIRKGYLSLKTVPALPEERAQVKNLNQKNTQHTTSTASDLVLAEPITDASSWFSDSQNAKLPTPKTTDIVKSVTEGHLELTINKFFEWSFLLHNDCCHVFGSSSYNIGGYPLHIEINSNPMAGHPGKSNEYFSPFHQRFRILLVCDYAFPDPALRLASNFVITLKTKNYNFQDHKINCSTVFSTYNKSGETLVASSVIANPNNGLLHRDDTLCVVIDVEFNDSKELAQKPRPN